MENVNKQRGERESVTIRRRRYGKHKCRRTRDEKRKNKDIYIYKAVYASNYIKSL